MEKNIKWIDSKEWRFERNFKAIEHSISTEKLDKNLRTYKVSFPLGALGNTEWWSEDDWKKHWEYVEKLKENGEYMKEVEFNVTLQHNSLFDNSLFKTE